MYDILSAGLGSYLRESVPLHGKPHQHASYIWSPHILDEFIEHVTLKFGVVVLT